MRGKDDTIFACCVQAKMSRPTFLIDVSVSMFDIMDVVKNHLIREITKMSFESNKYSFNMIAFSGIVRPWTCSILPCSKDNVFIASQWIRNLQCSKTKTTNLEDAIVEAMQDTATNGIYLVTNCLSNISSTLILEKLDSLYRKNCPVHCIYLTGPRNDFLSLTFLKDLAKLTEGTVNCLTLNEKGFVKDIKDISSDSFSIRKKQFSSINSDMRDHFFATNYAVQPSMAAYSMIDLKVLAKNLEDGLYYLGKVVQVTKGDSFLVEFDSFATFECASQKQNTHLRDLIAYEDAIRHDICCGDKVLAPFKANGSYAPATVIEMRDGSFRGDDEKDFMLVTFFNGETIEIKAETSLWISNHVFEKIRKGLFYPKPLQKKSTTQLKKQNQSSTTLMPTSIKTLQHSFGDCLNDKIERQIEEGRDLLQKLKLENHGLGKSLRFSDEVDDPDDEAEDFEKHLKFKQRVTFDKSMVGSSSFKREVPLSFPKPKTEAWTLKDNFKTDSRRAEEKQPLFSEHHDQLKDEGYHKHRLELLNHWEKHKDTQKYSPFTSESHIIEQRQCAQQSSFKGKEQGKTKKLEKRRVHVTATNKQRSRSTRTKHSCQPRPRAMEYQTFDGVNIPDKADRKFLCNDLSESWTPEKSRNNWQLEEKFNIITNKPIQEYSTNFVNGFGQRDLPVHVIDCAKDEFRKVMREERERKINKTKTEKDQINQSRQDHRRMNTVRRQEERREDLQRLKEGEEQNRKQRQDIRESIERFYIEKEENAQRYKYERIEAMQKKRNNFNDKKLHFQNEVLEYQVTSNENGATNSKDQRKNAFEAGIENQIKMEELKLERLKRINKKRLTKEYTRTDNSFKSTDLNSHVKDVSRQTQRANILP